MSAQINLYHPRFLKQRELLTLGNVLLAAAVLYGVVALAGGWAWRDAATRAEAAASAETQLKVAKDAVDLATKAAGRQANPQLIAEVASAEAQLRRRGEIAQLLESGAVGSTGGFAEHLRGLARQVPEGLWLTGFAIGPGGWDMEIRGSMLDAAALPDYIRRLGGEKAFQGRSFASLTMNRAESAPVLRPVGQATAVSPAPTLAPRPIDFVLMPKLAEAKEAKP
jgi:Tfp pilus assembly protein PilN